MKDLQQTLVICAVCLFLGAIIVIGTAYSNNTGTGLIVEQARIAQAYPEQVQHITTIANANRTNAQADAIRAEAESTRAGSVVVVVFGLVFTFLVAFLAMGSLSKH